MQGGKVVSLVYEKLSKVIDDLGYELYDVTYNKAQNGMNLTLYIVKNDNLPVTIDDCELVHRTVDPILDEIDPTNGESYYLNVSSLGLNRPIKTDKDFKRSIGQDVVVKLYVQENNKKEFVGTIKSFNEENVTFVTDSDDLVIKRSNIASCKLDIKF